MVAVADHIGSDFHQHLSPYGQSSVCHFFRQSVGHNFMLLTAAAAGIANFRCWLQTDIQPPEIEVCLTPSKRHLMADVRPSRSL